MKKYLLLLVCCLMFALVGCKGKFVGEWELTGAEVAGVEVSLEAMGFDAEDVADMKIVVKRNGTAIVSGEEYSWEKDGKNFVVSYEGEEIARGTVEKKTMKLEMYEGVYLIYKKK